MGPEVEDLLAAPSVEATAAVIAAPSAVAIEAEAATAAVTAAGTEADTIVADFEAATEAAEAEAEAGHQESRAGKCLVARRLAHRADHRCVSASSTPGPLPLISVWRQIQRISSSRLCGRFSCRT